MADTLEVITSEVFRPEEFAKEAIQKPDILNDLMELIFEKKEQIRFNSYETLRIVSETDPEKLYPRWSEFEDLLSHKNNYLRFIGINLITNLVSVDREGYFEKAFDRFYGILKEDITIAPAYVVRNSWKIVHAKPELEPKVTSLLLHMDSIHPGKQVGLIKGEAIETFDKFFEISDNKEGIIEFVKDQMDNPSPKARKLAKEFLEKRENG